MRAAVFEGEGRLVVKDVPEPTPGPGEVLVEVEACSVCGSDLLILSVPPGHPSTPPVILGHESVGRIRAAGAGVPASMVGLRVVADPDPKCGACDPCRTGRPANCENIVALGVHRDGALARYVTVPANSVYAIDESVPGEQAALVEPLACVVNGTNRIGIRPGERAVVFGAGAIGCLFIAVLKASGAGRIVAVEPIAARASTALAVGADDVVDPAAWATRRAELMPGGAPVVVDAVGSVLPAAIEAAAMGGRILLFGMNSRARPEVAQVAIVEKGLSIFGSFISNFTFPAAIRLIENGLDVAAMVSDVVPLEETAAVIARLRAGDGVKYVVRP